MFDLETFINKPISNIIDKKNAENEEYDIFRVEQSIKNGHFDKMSESSRFEAMLYDHARIRHEREGKILSTASKIDAGVGIVSAVASIGIPALIDYIGGIALETGSLKTGISLGLVTSALMIGRAGYLYSQGMKAKQKAYECEERFDQIEETNGTNRVIYNGDQRVGAGPLAFFGDKEL